MKILPTIHYIAESLLRATDPITVNVIGAGGTGGRLMWDLADMTATFHALDHPGLQVRLFDNDIINEPNIGRQKFSPAEIGLPKATAIINRINRYYGFNWEAVPEYYNTGWVLANDEPFAQITITCVDKVAPRLGMAQILQRVNYRSIGHEYHPAYWMDCGNSRHTGQVILATVGKIAQKKSMKFTPVEYLPSIVEEYGDLLTDEPGVPSCSVRQAIASQDLYINREVAAAATGMLWQLLHDGAIRHRAVFVNTADHRKIPVAIEQPVMKKKAA